MKIIFCLKQTLLYKICLVEIVGPFLPVFGTVWNTPQTSCKDLPVYINLECTKGSCNKRHFRTKWEVPDHTILIHKIQRSFPLHQLRQEHLQSTKCDSDLLTQEPGMPHSSRATHLRLGQNFLISLHSQRAPRIILILIPSWYFFCTAKLTYIISLNFSFINIGSKMDHKFWKQFAKQDGREPQLKFYWRRRSLQLLDIHWLLCLYWICCSVFICFN